MILHLHYHIILNLTYILHVNTFYTCKMLMSKNYKVHVYLYGILHLRNI